MAIKYLNPKSYGEVLQRLINGYKKVKGTNPQGLDLVKIKLEAMEQIRESKKIIKLPEEKITDYTKDRPTEGPKAEVKKFPTKNKPATQTYSLDFLDLLEDFNKIKANNKKTKKSMFELMDDLQALTKEYKKTETKKITTSDFLRDYFNLPNPQGPDQKGLMKVAMDKGKKEKAEMLAMGLDPSDMKDYEKYMKIKAASKDKVTSAEDIIKDDDFDPSGMAGGGLAYLLGEEPVKMGKGGAITKALEAALKKLGNKVTTADKIKRPESALRREMFDDFNKRLKEKTTDTEITLPSGIKGKGRFTRAEAIIARLENTIQGAKDSPDETSDYVLKNFPNMIEELKNKPELANNENVWKELGMKGLPKNQRFKFYDDGTVDFETLKPTHQFKLREDIKRKLNAEGGRIGFSGGIIKQKLIMKKN
jgi:hypothetical protein